MGSEPEPLDSPPRMVRSGEFKAELEAPWALALTVRQRFE